MVEVRDDDDLNPVFSSTLYHGSIVHTAEPVSLLTVKIFFICICIILLSNFYNCI